MGNVTSTISSLGDIVGSIGSALSFESLKLNIFGCELNANVAVSDFYTFATGGSSQSKGDTPDINNIEKSVSKNDADGKEKEKAPESSSFAKPTGATKNIDNRVGTSTAETRAAAAEERNLARQAITL